MYCVRFLCDIHHFRARDIRVARAIYLHVNRARYAGTKTVLTEVQLLVVVNIPRLFLGYPINL